MRKYGTYYIRLNAPTTFDINGIHIMIIDHPNILFQTIK